MELNPTHTLLFIHHRPKYGLEQFLQLLSEVPFREPGESSTVLLLSGRVLNNFLSVGRTRPRSG